MGPTLYWEGPSAVDWDFILNSKEMPMGPNPQYFLRSGWGGSKMVVDLDAKD